LRSYVFLTLLMLPPEKLEIGFFGQFVEIGMRLLKLIGARFHWLLGLFGSKWMLDLSWVWIIGYLGSPHFFSYSLSFSHFFNYNKIK